MDPLVPTRRTSRALQRVGLRARLLIERLDGAEVTDADAASARRALDELDDLEARAERAIGGSGRGNP